MSKRGSQNVPSPAPLAALQVAPAAALTGREVQAGSNWGRVMQRRREDAGMDQESAARRLGIHPITLSRYETGARRIPDAILERMNVLYGSERDTSDAHLAYWSGRQDQLVRLMRQVMSEQERLADDMRSAVGISIGNGA